MGNESLCSHFFATNGSRGRIGYMKISTLVSEFLDFVFVPRCFSCSEMLLRPSDAVGPARCFCDVCADALLALDSPKCSCCAEPFMAGDRDHLCHTCLRKPPPFDRIVAPLEYGGPLADALVRFKYAPAPFMAKELGRLLTWDEPRQPAVVIPVPLHPKRLAQRGFNQAALMARVFCQTHGGVFGPNTLRRLRNQEAQVGKTKKERIENMKNAFQVRDPKGILANKHVVLVDDVVTTTATVRAAAHAIIKEGRASTVTVVALGRASVNLS